MKKTANYLKGYARMSSLLMKVAAQTWKTPSGLRADTVLGNTSYQHYNPEINSVGTNARFVLPPKVLYSEATKREKAEMDKRVADARAKEIEAGKLPGALDNRSIWGRIASGFGLRGSTLRDRNYDVHEARLKALEKARADRADWYWGLLDRAGDEWAQNPQTYSLREALSMRDSGLAGGRFMRMPVPDGPEYETQKRWAKTVFRPALEKEWGKAPYVPGHTPAPV